MKLRTNTFLSVLFAMFVMGATAHAQVPRGGGPAAGADLLNHIGGEIRVGNAQAAGAWWTNPGIIQRLGMTDDQKAKIERTFDNHRERIVASTALLEKEEAQLARLLQAEPLDRNAVLGQIDRVAQARSEMERENSAMTFEMRESLTRAQWLQLQSPSRVRVGANVEAGNLINQVAPVYPESARQTGIQGDVILEVEISREGLVENLKVISGNPQLTQAAINAVSQWRYKPMLMNGAAVPVTTTVNVGFPFQAGGGRPAAAPRGQRRGQQ